MATTKFLSGSRPPAFSLSLVGGGQVTLEQPQKKGNWQVVFIYRGLHCPICKKYLKNLENLKDKFGASGVEIVAVSGDPESKTREMIKNTGANFPWLMDYPSIK